MSDKMLKVKDAATRLGISKARVVELIESGDLHALNVAGGKLAHWRVFVASCERYEKAKKKV